MSLSDDLQGHPYAFRVVREAVKELKEWAIKWGYKGISRECEKEFEEIVGEELSK